MKYVNFLFLIALIGLKYQEIESHGRLLDPPARSSCWREFPNQCKADYTDNERFCGGFTVQWNQNGGKCGICGDNWSGPRTYERGGSGYTGYIVRSYKSGQTIDVKVELTSNHLGWIEFRLCNADSLYAQGLDATHECLDKNLLKDLNGQTRIKVNAGERMLLYKLVLPSGLSCNRCVLQWKYHAGNSWGFDPATGASGLGEGPQEEFYGCSDVSIGQSDSTTQQTIISTSTSTTTNIQTTDKTTTRVTSSGNKCFSGDGYYADKASGCKNFYLCVNGMIYNFSCAAGTLFDQNISACMHENLVSCN